MARKPLFRKFAEAVLEVCGLSLVLMDSDPRGSETGRVRIWARRRDGMPYVTRASGRTLRLAVETDTIDHEAWDPVRLRTNAPLAAYSYDPGSKRLTFDAVGSQSVAGVATALNDRILYHSIAGDPDEGIFGVVVKGDAGTQEVWQRTADADESSDFVDGKTVTIGEGTYAGSSWVFTVDPPFVLDSDAVVFGRDTYTVHTDDDQVIAGLKRFVNLALRIGGAIGFHKITTTATVERTMTLPNADFTVAQAGEDTADETAINAEMKLSHHIRIEGAPTADDVSIMADVALANGPQILAGQPIVPCKLILHVTDADASIVAGSVRLIGIGASGEAIDVTHALAGGTRDITTAKPFAHVTSIEVAGLDGAGGGDKLKIGQTSALGLPAVQTASHWTVFKANCDGADEAVGALDAAAGTMIPSTAPNGVHVYDVWYVEQYEPLQAAHHHAQS